MLTLNPDSVCDVCAEEYGPFNLPRCIPCGHVLCEYCATTIVEKTSPRLQPTCPFCRESFTTDGVRVIRIDFSQSSGGGASGPSSVLLHHSMDSAPRGDGNDDDDVVFARRPRSASTSARSSRDPSRATSRERGIFQAIDEDRGLDLSRFDNNRHRDRADELEKKVAKVATKRCSPPEVEALGNELGEWLKVEKAFSTSDPQQYKALHLSYLLVKAILMNHDAHAEATKVAKGVEHQLRSRLHDDGLIRENLENELRKTKAHLSAKTAEAMSLRSELSRLKGGAMSTRRQSVSAAPSSLSAPTSPDGYFPASFSSAGTAALPHSNPGSGSSSASSSGRTTPTAGLMMTPLSFPSNPNSGSGHGTSSASAAAAALQARSTSPTPASRHHHTRTTSLMHRPMTPGASPMQHSVSSALPTHLSSRRAMTPGPGMGHHRSASVAPGASSGVPPVPNLPRSMTPGIHAMSHSSRSHAHASPSSTVGPGSGYPNGLSAGANHGVGGSSVPPIPVPVSSLSHSKFSVSSTNSEKSRDSDAISTSPGHPRPPVPPKPRTLSQSTGAQMAASARRGVVDDRDGGYLSEIGEKDRDKTVRGLEKEKRKERKHERWLPSALVDRINRPQTSLS